MNGLERTYVRETIENEGFDYAMVDYSDYEEIKDLEFHRLLSSYITARTELADYIGVST